MMHSIDILVTSERPRIKLLQCHFNSGRAIFQISSPFVLQNDFERAPTNEGGQSYPFLGFDKEYYAHLRTWIFHIARNLIIVRIKFLRPCGAISGRAIFFLSYIKTLIRPLTNGSGQVYPILECRKNYIYLISCFQHFVHIFGSFDLRDNVCYKMFSV